MLITLLDYLRPIVGEVGGEKSPREQTSVFLSYMVT